MGSCGSRASPKVANTKNEKATEKSVLMVLTSCDKHEKTGAATGYWDEEFAAPYYLFKEAGLRVVLASPAGGKPPVDPGSLADDFQTEPTKRLAGDKDAQAQLASTKKLSEVSATSFDAVFYPGGHGPMYDLHSDKTNIELLNAFLKAGKPVAAVCHGPAAIVKGTYPDGSSIFAGKAATCFSNTEEDAVGLTPVVPFMLEDTVKSLGAKYSKVDDWHPHAVSDSGVITGQNPASSTATAKKLLEALA